MKSNTLDRDPAMQSPVERVQRWVHGSFDRVINPVVVGGMGAVGRGINTTIRGIKEFGHSLFSRS
ncbi:MAG: hypothetical protein ABIG34_05615 [Candidatus Peregrinibacteria bacterium]